MLGSTITSRDGVAVARVMASLEAVIRVGPASDYDAVLAFTDALFGLERDRFRTTHDNRDGLSLRTPDTPEIRVRIGEVRSALAVASIHSPGCLTASTSTSPSPSISPTSRSPAAKPPPLGGVVEITTSFHIVSAAVAILYPR